MASCGFNASRSASGTSFQRCTTPALISVLSLSQSDFFHVPELYGFKEQCVIVGRRTKKLLRWLHVDVSRNTLCTFQDRTAFHLCEERQKQQKKVWISAFLSHRSNNYGVCLLQSRIGVQLGKHHFKKPKPLVIVVPARIYVSSRWKCSQILILNKCTTLDKSPKVVLETVQHITGVCKILAVTL